MRREMVCFYFAPKNLTPASHCVQIRDDPLGGFLLTPVLGDPKLSPKAEPIHGGRLVRGREAPAFVTTFDKIQITPSAGPKPWTLRQYCSTSFIVLPFRHGSKVLTVIYV